MSMYILPNSFAHLQTLKSLIFVSHFNNSLQSFDTKFITHPNVILRFFFKIIYANYFVNFADIFSISFVYSPTSFDLMMGIFLGEKI